MRLPLPLPFSILTPRASLPHLTPLQFLLPRHISTSHPTTPPHPIVSSFLSTGTEGTPSFRIALFKRSDQVTVYRTLHAPLSGHIEPHDLTPLAAALREIHEETRLAPPLISLVRAGVFYELADATLGMRWRIYTFLWRLHGCTLPAVAGKGGKSGDEEEEGRLRAMMTLCGENTSVVFVRPEEVPGMETVPGLERGVRAVVRGHFRDGLAEGLNGGEIRGKGGV